MIRKEIEDKAEEFIDDLIGDIDDLFLTKKEFVIFLERVIFRLNEHINIVKNK